MTTTLIVDGNHLAHRARHVFSLSNKGVDVSVTYGFLKTLSTYTAKYKPGALIVCWDAGVPEHRRKALPQYKANRHKDEDPLAYEDFIRQLNELADYALPLTGALSLRGRGMEADDLMYQASRMLKGQRIIISGDTDLLQAVTPGGEVKVYHPGRDKLYDYTTLEAEYDIAFSNYIDWRALQGDSSDNIPGVPGIGEKTATKLFKEYGTLTAIINCASGHGVPGKSVMTDRIKQAINEFGLDRIAKNVYVMALYADRVGARRLIYQAVNNYQPGDANRLRKYFMRNAFVTLLDSGLTSLVSKLSAPELAIDNMRIPVIATTRTAYE